MATVQVDQAKLVLNAFASIFENNLISKDVVTWNKFSSEMNPRNALEVVEQVTPDYTTTFTRGAVADLTSGVQDTTFGSERYKLEQMISSSMGWGDFVKIRDIGEARESQALRKAALRLATDIDSYILGFAATASNNWLGDGSSDVSQWDDVASGYTRLMQEGVMDSDLCLILAPEDKQALGSEIVDSTNNASLTGLGAEVYRKAFTGSVANIPTMFTQQLPELTVGTRVATGASLTNYASGSPAVTYESVSTSPAVGQFKTGLLNLDGQTGNVTLVDGETFTIAGIFAYDSRAKKRLPYLQEFRVVGDATAAAGVFTGVRYYPAIIDSGPYQTVVNTNAGGSYNNLAVTHKGAAGAALYPRFICNKDAIVVHTADLPMPLTGTARKVSLSKVPMSVRMWQDSDFNTGEHRIRFDVAVEANVAPDGRRRIVRING